MRCSTLNTERQGTLNFGLMSLTLDSKKVKKNSVVEKSESENASVGQIPTQAAASTPVLLAKLGKLSTSCMDSGQASIHFLQSENLLIARTQEAISKCKDINSLLLHFDNFHSILHSHTHNLKVRILE